MSQPQPLSADLLKRLSQITSPTICNAIEPFKARDQAEGFMGPEIKCVFPQLGTLVAYACTATIGARTPSGKSRVGMTELWEHIASVPAPRVLVVQDIDYPRPLGSFWGEVNANICRAQGVIGTITDGGVRDLDEVERLGFYYFASAVLVSHANVHLIDVGGPVEVGGLRVQPGDLLHGDKHGVAQIPLDLAPKIPEAAQRIEEAERKIIALCQSPDFTPQKLMAMFQAGYR